MNKLCDAGVDLLRNAIVEQAAKDYRRVVARKKRHPKYGNYNGKELEEIFGSAWFQWLTDVDGNYIKREIRRRYGK